MFFAGLMLYYILLFFYTTEIQQIKYSIQLTTERGAKNTRKTFFKSV